VKVRAGSEALIDFRLGISVSRQGPGSRQSALVFTSNSACWIQQQTRLLALFVLLILSFVTVPSFAACHAITPSGSGSKTGADWNNAYAGIPATLTRGVIYYLADGSYPAYTFSTADSGSTTIEIRKSDGSIPLITALSSLPPQWGGSAFVGKYRMVAGCI
jgi:hypothetical protein